MRLEARSSCPDLPASVEVGALDGLAPARYLLTAIAVLATADGDTHPVRCGLFTSDGILAGVSPDILLGKEDRMQQVTWNAIEAVRGGGVSVRCQIQACGGASADAVRVFGVRIAAVRSE